MNFKGIFSVTAIMFALGSLMAVSVFAEDPAAATPAGNNPAPKSASSDSNGDGKPDQWQYYEYGQIVRTEADTNFDGKVDEIGHFTSGKLTKLEKDSDFDGKMDKWVEY